MDLNQNWCNKTNIDHEMFRMSFINKKCLFIHACVCSVWSWCFKIILNHKQKGKQMNIIIIKGEQYNLWIIYETYAMLIRIHTYIEWWFSNIDNENHKIMFFIESWCFQSKKSIWQHTIVGWHMKWNFVFFISNRSFWDHSFAANTTMSSKNIQHL